MAITRPAVELRRARAGEIRKHLRRVSGPHVQVAPEQGLGVFGFTAYRGSTTTVDRRDWTFPSRVKSIVCHYGELWEIQGVADDMSRLQNLQFHLLEHRGPEEKPIEILAFHWHPSTSDTDAEAGHDRRPHLHVSLAPEPLPKSHLGVSLSVPDSDQSTVKYLDALLEDAIGMIDNEVLNRLKSTPLARRPN